MNINEYIYPARRQVTSFIPAHFHITETVASHINTNDICNWIKEHLSGAWAVQHTIIDDNYILRVGFENQEDLLFFSLAGGFNINQGR